MNVFHVGGENIAEKIFIVSKFWILTKFELHLIQHVCEKTLKFFCKLENIVVQVEQKLYTQKTFRKALSLRQKKS